MKFSVCAIGVDRFLSHDNGLDILSYCASDADAFLKQIRSLCSIKYSRLLTPSTQNLPTRSNIIKSIVDLARYAEQDPVIVYFAGHGMNISGEFHMIPYDFDSAIPQFSAVGISLLMEIISPSAPWVLFFLDACRSSLVGFSKVRRRNRYKNAHGLLVAENVCLLFGCSPGERSFELPAIKGGAGGGVFTYFFLEEMRRAARRGNETNLSTVFAACRNSVTEYVVEAGLGTQSPISLGVDPAEVFILKEE